MLKRILFLSVILLFWYVSALAQPGPGHRFDRQRKIHERVQSIKMLKLIETLDLNEEQSARFFPRYRQFEQELNKINVEMKRLLDDLAHATIAGMEESKLEEFMDGYENLLKSGFEKKVEFWRNSTDILTKNQQARLVVFEERFPQKIREIVEEMRGPHGPGGPGYCPPYPDARGGEADW